MKKKMVDHRIFVVLQNIVTPNSPGSEFADEVNETADEITDIVKYGRKNASANNLHFPIRRKQKIEHNDKMWIVIEKL